MLFDFLIRNKLAIILAIVSIAALASAGVRNLQVSADNRIFYGPDNEYFADYLDFEQKFTTNDNILFVISAPFLITERNYPEAIRWLSHRVGGLPHVIRTDGLANYPMPNSEGESVSVEPVLDQLCPEGRPCRQDLDDALAGSHLVNRLVSPDKHTTGVVATVSIERGAVGTLEALNQSALDLTTEFKHRYPEYQIYFTGGVPMMAAFASATARDLVVILPIALAVISALLIFVLGSARLASYVILVGMLSIVITLGVAGWTVQTINNATSIIPLVVFTLVVTSSLHLVVHFCRNLPTHATPADARAQARASLQSSVTPIALSATTSIASLCSLYFVDSPPLRQLGLLSAAGVGIGCLLTIVVLPYLMLTVRHVAETRVSGLLQSGINRYARVLEREQSSAWISATLLVVCALGVLRLSIDDDFVRFFDKSVPFRIQTDHATELLAGPNHIEVILTSAEGTVFDPDYLRYLDSLTGEIRGHPLVANAHSFSDVMHEISLAFSDTTLHDLVSSEEAAQLFLIYELSLQMGQSNTDLVSADQTSARVSVLLRESSSSEIQDLETALYRWHARSGQPHTIVVTGENIPVAHLSELNIKSMARGIVISLTFTALIIGIVFRSAKLGLVALIATTVPVVAGFGIWGWIESEIGLAATAIIALSIGVVVDDAAHFIYRFMDGRSRMLLTPWEAAAYAVHRTGTAISSSSIVMGVGVALLAFSDFEVNSTFGIVTCLIFTVALLFTILVLPRLTVWVVQSDPDVVARTA